MFHHISEYFGVSTYAGYAGVSLFAIMSGFLCGFNNIDNTKLRHGIKIVYKKLRQFMPLHIIMFLGAFGLLIVDAIKDGVIDYKLITLRVIFNLSFTQAFVPIRKIYFGLNGVEWYLSIYFFFCYYHLTF